jgi:bacillithiol biosynthesis cysteine-adding enzyme BshC
MSNIPNKKDDKLFSDEEITSKIDRLSSLCMPDAVHQAILKQHEGMDLSDKQAENLQLLNASGTNFVVTGQQIGLFLGPLFTLYKALAAVVTAEKITKLNGKRCVPVFWLQTEDHDFEEIQSTQLLTRDYGPRKVSLDSSIHPERSSVEHTILDAEIEQALETLDELYGHLPNAKRTINLFRSSYVPGRKISDSFRLTLHGILKDTGILFFNPRDIDNGSIAADLFKKLLLEHEQIEHLLKQSGKRIAEDGSEEQVFVRHDSPLFFYHPDGAGGPRFRIELKEPDVWEYIGRSGAISTAELLKALESDPMQFSTTALSRPILQSLYFPTIAYIGGDAELRYYRQIDTLFSHFGLQEPAVAPRPHFTLVESKINDWLEALQLSVDEATLSENEVLTLLAGRIDGNLPSPQDLEHTSREGITRALEPMRKAFELTDETILRSFDKNRDKMLANITPLISRYTKALANNDEVRSQRLEKIRSSLLPNNVRQEREYAAVAFICKYGSSFIDQITNQIVPFSKIDEVINL